MPWVLLSPASLSSPALSAPASSLLAASYENRVSFLNGGITFQSVTRKDTGMYTCMVSDEGGNTYGEVTVQLIVLGTCHRSMWVAAGCFPKPLAGSAKLQSSLIVSMLVAGCGWGREEGIHSPGAARE